MEEHPLASDAKPLVFVLDGSIDITGALVAARRQASLLQGEVRFVLLLPAASRVPDASLPEFERVIRLPMVDLRRSWRAVLLYGPALLVAGYRLARELQRHDCRYVQVNDFHLMQAAVARAFGYRGKILTWVRFDPIRYGALGRLWLRVDRSVSARMVAVSMFIAGRMPRGITTDLHYDPPPDWASPLPPPATQTFAFVGNYIPGKGQDDAIRAFARIAADFPAARLHFHGGDMALDKNRLYRRNLEQLAEKLGCAGQITFGDFVRDPRQPLAASLAAISMSHSESFGFTCLEASMAGRAVLATRSGGPEEIVAEGVTGYLVDVGDDATMASRMKALLLDPARAAEMGAAGRELVKERFSAERFRSEYRALFGLSECPQPHD